jgi:hypothetical protein
MKGNAMASWFYYALRWASGFREFADLQARLILSPLSLRLFPGSLGFHY